jgi:hypothetical protein
VKMWCEICKKWNHTTLQCWKNPENYVNRELETSLDAVVDVTSGDEKDCNEGHAIWGRWPGADEVYGRVFR